jgi:replicative DNA helicase
MTGLELADNRIQTLKFFNCKRVMLFCPRAEKEIIVNNVVSFIKPSHKAEIAVLCWALCGTKPEFKDFIQQLERSDFTMPKHQVIFEAVKWLLDQEKPLDVITVAERLDTTGKLDEAGGRFYLMNLAMSAFQDEDIEKVVRVLSHQQIH